jgi:hypothetical protein
MYFYRREIVNNLLRLGNRQSYRTVKATPSGMIRSDVLLALLNRTRVGIDSPLSTLPSDLLTPEEAESTYGVTQHQLRRWSHRKRNPSPHYRLNKYTIRYPQTLLGEWLKEHSI